jgi:hypothetical protein
MITDSKIEKVQNRIKAAIAKIEKEENVKISFGNIRYNSAYYTTQLKVSTTEKSNKVTNVYEGICKRLGFTQNIIGMKFMSGKILMEIVDIKTRNRKYPILTIGSNGKHYKHTVGQVKTLIGGDKIINRNANLDKILND